MAQFFFSFATGVVALFALIRLAPRMGLVDHPAGRKQHSVPTPAIGGVAIFTALMTLPLTPLVANSDYLWIVPVLGMLVALGLWDDMRDATNRARIFGHFAAGAAMVLLAGNVLQGFGDLLGTGDIALPFALGLPLTMFAVASAVNALNLSDGVDGLASGLALIPLLIMAALSVRAGLAVPAAVATVFSGAVVAFMLFNFPLPGRPHALCFLGDAGTSVLGLGVVWLMIDLTQQGVFHPITALFLLGLPLLDTAGVIVRRLRLGLHPMTPGRDHLHHILLNGGFTARQTTLTLLAGGVLFALMGLGMDAYGMPESLSFLVYVVTALLFLWGTRSSEATSARLRALFFKKTMAGTVAVLPVAVERESEPVAADEAEKRRA